MKEVGMKDLIKRVSRATKHSQAATERTIKALFEEMTLTLMEHDGIRIMGFGWIRPNLIHKKAALLGGKYEVKEGDYYKISFRPSQILKNKVNGRITK